MSATSPRGKLGFRVLAAPPPLGADLVASFRAVASSTVADAMGRFGFMDPAIRARTALGVCGLAVTVNCRPGDNLMVHKALHVAAPGDVIVVRTGGNTTNAVFGELMAHTAVAQHVGGVVVDGAIRDVEGIARLGLAAFSRSVSPGACDKDGPGEINVPISCGDTVVAPGDLVLGDADGVVVVPRDLAREVHGAVALLLERERTRLAEIHGGQAIRGDIDDLLRARGVI
jgi:4-hydroxy-4-methyl-2-oxoglutarate aldolase